MLPDKLAFVDVETTGTSARYGRIIEIGIVRVENNEITSVYNTLIDPQTSLPPEIELLTGITRHDLENQPTFRSIAREIMEILADCTFVAHNVRFDYSFLKHEFLREQIAYSAKHFCTVRLSRALFPEENRHNLDAIIQRFNFSIKNRHRAYDDAHILWQFYTEIQKQFPSDTIEKAISLAMRRPNIPLKLEPQVLDSLPEQPGVYIFYGKKDGQGTTEIPLYIGKSKNIKDRVLSHFCGDITSPSEMNIAQQIERIETQTTAGEMGALFLESKLIKEKLPLYNKQLRVKRELIGLRKIATPEGYDSVQVEVLKTLHFDDLSSFIGIFKSKSQAKEFLIEIKNEYKLCEKLLGLEKTKGACFSYRLNKCNGACIQKEQPLYYNLRFTTAFFKTKIKPWPFSGPIVIEEANELLGTREYFIIDKWCYIGSAKHSELANLQTTVESEYIFDMDMYKILLRFLRKPEVIKKIKHLDPKKLSQAHTSFFPY